MEIETKILASVIEELQGLYGDLQIALIHKEGLTLEAVDVVALCNLLDGIPGIEPAATISGGER